MVLLSHVLRFFEVFQWITGVLCPDLQQVNGLWGAARRISRPLLGNGLPNAKAGAKRSHDTGCRVGLLSCVGKLADGAGLLRKVPEWLGLAIHK